MEEGYKDHAFWKALGTIRRVYCPPFPPPGQAPENPTTLDFWLPLAFSAHVEAH